MKQLGTNLRLARKRRKLSVEDAAELCSVGRATWFAYESGRATPTLAGLVHIARTLETTCAALVKSLEKED